LSREGSISCHTCCNTGPRFFRSHPKDRSIQSPLTTHEGMWRIYYNPDPHGGLLFEQKVNCRLKCWYRQAIFFDQKSKFSLCTALTCILCHLDYSCSSWYSGLSKAMKRKFQICQNKVIRFILDLSPMHSINYSILTIFDSIDMLNVDRRMKQMRLNHVLNIVHNKAPVYLETNFSSLGNISSNTRSSVVSTLNCHRLNIAKIRLFITMPSRTGMTYHFLLRN
jgi:hypothetical protein